MKIIVNGIDALLSSMSKFFDGGLVYVFMRSHDYKILERFITSKNINVMKISNPIDLIRSFSDREQRRILITTLRQLDNLIRKYGIDMILATFRGAVVICIDVHNTQGSEILSKSKKILDEGAFYITPSYLYEIPLSLMLASAMLEKELYSSSFIILSERLLNSYEELDLELLEKNNRIKYHDDLGARRHYLRDDLNSIVENDSNYAIVSYGVMFREIFSFLFEQNKLAYFSLIKIGLIDKDMIRDLIQFLKEKDYIIVIDPYNIIRGKISDVILDYFYKGELNRIPVIITDSNLRLIPDEEIFELIENLFIRVMRNPWQFIERDIRLVAPIDSSLIALIFLLNKILERRESIVILPIELSECISTSDVQSIVTYRRMINIFPIIADLEKKKALKVLVLYGENLDMSDIHELTLLERVIDITFFLYDKENKNLVADLGDALSKKVYYVTGLDDLKKLLEDASLKGAIVAIPLKLSDEAFKNIYIDESKCVRCDDCLTYTLCPAITKDISTHLFIDHMMCRRCGICALACKYDAINLVRRS